jgi:L-lactate permease
VRIKAIVLGAVAVLAMATLTANAGTTATPRVSGSLVSLVAATTTVTKAADREAVTVAARSTESEKTAEAAEKPVVAVKPVAPRALRTSAACQQAIATLKAMHEADVAEDAAERTTATQQPMSAAGLAADRAEDLAEAQKWTQALTATRTACLPQPSAACQAAIANLQALRPANLPEDWRDMVKLPNQIDLAALRAAFIAVATACGHRD